MVIGKPDTLRVAIEKGVLFSHSSPADCLVELEIYIGAAPRAFMRDGQQVFDCAERLLNAMINLFSNMTDTQLRQQSKRQRHNLAAIAAIDYATYSEDILAYFNMMRDQFTGEQWDTIVAEKTRLEGMVRKNDGDQ